MPLYDHFRMPVAQTLPWETLHSSWATRLADSLNDFWLPKQFVALEDTHTGPKGAIDVLTLDKGVTVSATAGNGEGGVATLPQVWAPPAALLAIPTVFPDRFEVRIIAKMRGLPVVAAIELISPSNLHGPEERNAFITKCANYLHQQVSVVIIDVVTDMHFNLHNELVRFLRAPNEACLPARCDLYAAAYRPILRDEKPQIEIWAEACKLDGELPTMPLPLPDETFAPVEFEKTYMETCRKRRML